MLNCNELIGFGVGSAYGPLSFSYAGVNTQTQSSGDETTWTYNYNIGNESDERFIVVALGITQTYGPANPSVTINGIVATRLTGHSYNVSTLVYSSSFIYIAKVPNDTVASVSVTAGMVVLSAAVYVVLGGDELKVPFATAIGSGVSSVSNTIAKPQQKHLIVSCATGGYAATSMSLTGVTPYYLGVAAEGYNHGGGALLSSDFGGNAVISLYAAETEHWAMSSVVIV